METVVILSAIILAIIIGERFDVNAGLIAIAFAYLIGVFYIGIPVDDLFGMWPSELFLIIFGVSFFFNFATQNGTLDVISSHIIYTFRNSISWLPIGLYLAAAILSGLGAGTWGSIPIVGALSVNIVKQTKLNKTIAAIAVILGGMYGGNAPFGPHGAVINGVLRESGFQDVASQMTWQMWGIAIVYPLILLVILILWDRKRTKHEQLDLEKPEGFNRQQKQTLLLILIFIVILLVPAVLANFTDMAWVEDLNSKLDLAFLAIVFGIIAIAMRLSDAKKVLARVPWSTVFIACGMTFLISVGIEAGITEQISSVITRIPNAIIPIALTLMCGLLSVFSSTIGVLAPLFFPVIASISQASGWSTLLLASCVVIGGFSTGSSPFSDSGSLYLASSGYEFSEQKELYRRLLFKVMPTSLLAASVTILVLMLVETIV